MRLFRCSRRSIANLRSLDYSSRKQVNSTWSGLSWTADGNLLVSDSVRVLKLGADGKNQAQLLADPSAVIPNASPCGANYLVLSWPGHGSTNSESIWRTNADGSSPLRLTDGKRDRSPVCSPDQKWVYYSDCSENHISRVPLDGSGKSEAILRLPQNYDFDFGTELRVGWLFRRTAKR